jgi:hypothetical protein
MKKIFIFYFFFLSVFFTNKGFYVISRIYEGLYQFVFYEYEKWDDPEIEKICEFSEKLFFRRDLYDKAFVQAFVQASFEDSYTLTEKKNITTKIVRFDQNPYVLKKHIQKGFWKNLFKMGKCVLIWNHFSLLEKENAGRIQLVGLHERRGINFVETLLLYKWEGEVLDSFEDELISQKVKKLIAHMKKKNLVHADLRKRNIIYNSLENEIKLIDVELLHRYPKGSMVCKKRMEREERWLFED